jgi:hypothetical protein
MNNQRVILFAWRGFWMPDGPDNGRACVFSSEAQALAWAREAYVPECFDPQNFRFLPIPLWGDPSEQEPLAPTNLREALTYRFDLYASLGGPCEDSFQVRGRQQARDYFHNLDAFHEPGQMRIFVVESHDSWREIEHAELLQEVSGD